MTRSLALRAGISMACVVALGVAGYVLLATASAEAQYRSELERLARQGAVQLRDAEADREVLFRQWAWSALQSGDVLCASLTDASGRAEVTIPPVQGWAEALPLVRRGGSIAQRISFVENGEPKTLWRAAAPLRGKSAEDAAAWILVLARHRPLRGVSLGGALLLAATLMVVGGFGVAATASWFHHRVGEPLAALAALDCTADLRPAAGVGAGLPVDRPDEVGGVARKLAELANRLAEARERSDRAEQSVTWRVADQTRQINIQLRQAERAAWLDPLTRLGNRRLLDERLEKLFEAQREQGRDLCVVMLDLDNFKRLNDAKGHAAGDELLRFVGELLRGSLRPSDLGIRYGGDEFALILPDTLPGQAARTAERIVRLFRQRSSLIELDVRVSMSAGISSLRRSGADSGWTLLDLADRALYQAKSRGRAVLCMADAGRADGDGRGLSGGVA